MTMARPGPGRVRAFLLGCRESASVGAKRHPAACVACGKPKDRIFTPRMDLGKLHRLGRLGKPWGHRGELTLLLDGADLHAVQHMGFLFVELDGLRVPFPVSHLREHPRVGAVVKFEGYDDPQGAAFLVNADVYAPPGTGQPEAEEDEDDELDPEDLVGMQVLDEEHGELGEIVRTEGTEANPIMVVAKDGNEVLIPVVNELITGIDLETGHLVVRTPPGLVDLYRGG